METTLSLLDLGIACHEVFNVAEEKAQEIMDAMPSMPDEHLIETRRRARDLGQIAWRIECAADAEIVKRDAARGAKGAIIEQAAKEAKVSPRTMYVNAQVNDVVDAYCQSADVCTNTTTINFDKSLVVASLSADNPAEALKELVKLSDEKQSNLSYRQAIEEVEKITGAKAQVTVWTGNNERYTPRNYIELARQVMGGIDCDPASNDFAQMRIDAKTYYTEKDNGLCQEWQGRVWLNPPYSNPEIGQFIEKLIEEYRAGRCTQAILLTNNSADTIWFDRASSAATVICFTKGRIQFYDANDDTTQPTNGQTFFYFGNHAEDFAKAFSAVGGIYRRIA